MHLIWKKHDFFSQDIASALDCPDDSLSGLITCLRNDKTAAEIVNAHKTYYVSISITLKSYLHVL